MSTHAAARAPRIALPSARRVPWTALAGAVILLALAVTDALLQPALLDLFQIGLLLQTALPLVFVAAAQTFVVLVRGIDLSVGGMLVVTNTLTVVWVGGAGGSHQLLLLGVLAAGIVMGLLNGLLVSVLRFEPFIATLGTWTIYSGLALVILSTDGGTPPPWLGEMLLGDTAGIPNSIVIIAVLLGAWRGFRVTRLGAQLYAVGADEERARLNGTSVRKVKLVAYAAGGLCAALAGIFLAGLTSSGTPTAGDPYILTSVAAVVIGGTSLMGGSGGVGLSVMAALSLTLIADIASSQNLDVWVSVAASAALMLLVVTLQVLVQRRVERGAQS